MTDEDTLLSVSVYVWALAVAAGIAGYATLATVFGLASLSCLGLSVIA